MIYLDLESLLHVAEQTLGTAPVVRDHGLLESALARAQASAFGQDAYVTLYEKAGALLHSVARSRALLDGNKRLALAATIAFLGVNGVELVLTNDEAYELTIAVATGSRDDVAEIAAILDAGSQPRRKS